MDHAKKQRLVGGLVLVALLVILVPVVLDFSHDEQQNSVMVQVPVAPDPTKMEVLPLDVWSEKIEPDVKREKIVEAVSEPVATKVVESKPTNKAEQPTAVKQVIEPPAASKSSDSLSGNAWVVQIASVSKEVNALKLRDDLRHQGYEAYVVEGRSTAGKSLYRVRVGPELLRSKADKLKVDLRKATKLDGLVMRYQ